jgi:hypothetical protein
MALGRLRNSVMTTRRTAHTTLALSKVARMSVSVGRQHRRRAKTNKKHRRGRATSIRAQLVTDDNGSTSRGLSRLRNRAG